MRELRLERPVVFFDTETTGTDPRQDRIVEFAAVKLHPDGRRETMRTLVNPKEPIPREASAIHGITDEAVSDAPTFGEVAADILKFIDGCDLAGYNVVKFDVPLLRKELERIELRFEEEGVRLLDPQVIFFSREPRDLSAAVRFYCGRELEGAHGALADTEASLDVLLAQIARYPDLPEDVAGLAAASTMLSDDRFVDSDRRFVWRHGEAYFNFGKVKGKSLREVVEKNAGYLGWILDRDFSEEVKEIVRRAKQGRFPKQDATPGERDDG
ncbi:MAG: 3'-5' exonuclease [Deltaproteobacteria bacterium]|nr:3'-5' exonuclease [Deltaproteobacteria bacterium]